MARPTAALAALALVATLAACTPTPAPAPAGSPEPTVDTTPSETATVEPVAEPLSIPGCETLVPIATARAAFADSTEFLGETVATEYYPWYQLPAVTTAIGGLTVARACWWGVPSSDGAFSLLVAEIAPETRAAVEAALAAEAFSSAAMGTVTGYDAEREGMESIEAETQLFTGSLWIVSDNTGLESAGIIAASALEAVRAGNPTRGL